MCLDWILASTEYIEFVTMMLQFKGVQDWDGQEPEYSAFMDEEDEEGGEEEVAEQ